MSSVRNREGPLVQAWPGFEANQLCDKTGNGQTGNHTHMYAQLIMVEVVATPQVVSWTIHTYVWSTRLTPEEVRQEVIVSQLIFM